MVQPPSASAAGCPGATFIRVMDIDRQHMFVRLARGGQGRVVDQP